MLLWLGLMLARAEAPVVGAQCTLAKDVKVITEDDATIALHHHFGRGPPVLLVHGISSNHSFWDLDPQHSLAEWLVGRGWDVWAVDLRGHGTAMTTPEGRAQRAGWKIDDYGRYDLPAAVKHVRACTGYKNVAYVGHSMGGMVGAIYMTHGGADQLSANIAVGSPASFVDTGDPMVGLAKVGFSLGGTAFLWVATPLAADFAAIAPGLVPGRLQERLYNPANMDPFTIAPMMRNIVSPLARGEMKHFARMLQSGEFMDFRGEKNYLTDLGTVQVPTLVIAGEGDQVAPPAWVRPYYDAMGGEKEFLLAGPSSGFAEPYGHLDLGLGKNATTEIFPRIEAWLQAHPPLKGP